MPNYQTLDIVPLAFMRILNGAAVTGLSVTVVVKNIRSGAVLLSSTALTEVVAGVYSYSWTHGQTASTECVAQYTVGGVSYFENFTIESSLNTEEFLSGRAT